MGTQEERLTHAQEVTAMGSSMYSVYYKQFCLIRAYNDILYKGAERQEIQLKRFPASNHGGSYVLGWDFILKTILRERHGSKPWK